MAKSGNTTKNFGSSSYSLSFDWNVVSQNIETNSSVIEFALTLKDLKGYGATFESDGGIGVNVNGESFSDTVASGTVLSPNGSLVLLSTTTTIPHNSFDAQVFSYSYQCNWALSLTATGGMSFQQLGNSEGVLDAIVRSASLIKIYPDNPTDENRYTINYSNPAGNYATLLQIGAEFSDGKIAFAARDVDKTAGLTEFILTDADKQKLYNKLNEGYTEITVKFYIKSTVPAGSGSETVKSEYISKIVNFVKYFPKLDPEVVEGNSDVFNLTQNNSIMVAGMSDAVFSTGAEAVKGATIVRQYISNGDQQLDNTFTGTLNAVTSNTFYFYVEDSRGNVTRDFKVVTWIPYVKPTCKVKTENITTDGKLTVYLSGKYFNGSFGATSNSLYMDYKVYKDGEDVPETWNMKILSPTVDEDNNYTETVTISGLEYDKRYRFIVKVFDELTTSAETSGIVAAEPLFDWGKDDFRFYIPVIIQDNPLNDYVIETGTAEMGSNGTWYWAKWRSGRAECYGLRNYGNTAVTTSWGNLYRSEVFTQSLPSGLFVEGGPEYINISPMTGGHGGWIVMHEQSAPSESTTGSFIFVRPASATSTRLNLSFNCIGRWK